SGVADDRDDVGRHSGNSGPDRRSTHGADADQLCDWRGIARRRGPGMRIGVLSVAPGEKAFGFLGAGESRGRFPAQVPLHIVRGTSDGPTLVVQAGVSGLELEPAIVLPGVVRALDPMAVKG